MPSNEFIWFQEHYGKLSRKYAGKVVAIVNNKLVGVGNTITEADKQAKKITNQAPFFGKIRKRRAMIL